MPSHILKTDWTKIASKGEFVEAINIAPADAVLSTGFRLSGAKAAPVGGRYNAMGVADDLFAKRAEDGNDKCEIMVTTRPANPPASARY